MEIRVIPAKLQKHTVYLEEEIRISRCIQEMAEELFGADPGKQELLHSIRALCKSIERRRDILEDLEEALQNQEAFLQEYVEKLQESQRR